MKLYLSFVFFLFAIPAYCQYTNKGANEFCLSDGLLSYDQWAGILWENTEARPYIGTPTTLTGAAFLTYRHYLANRVALGVATGLDHQGGPLKDIGFYRRRVYTVAMEATLVYHAEQRSQLYGSIGVGYTTVQDYYHVIPPYLFSSFTPGSDHYTANFNHINANVTAVGLRSMGTVAGFVELGFGYKGMFVLGLSCKIRSHKFAGPSDNLELPKEVLILPYGYPDDGRMEYMTTLNEKGRSLEPYGGSNELIDYLSFRVRECYGNVFRVTGARYRSKNNLPDFRGRVYYLPELDSIIATIKAKKAAHFENGTSAYLVIYYPNLYHGARRSASTLTINDTLTLNVSTHSKVVYKISKEGNYKVKVQNGGEMINVHVKRGNDYYIEIYADRKNIFFPKNHHDHLQLMDPLRGELEASIIH